jgi:hypothetical protein
MKNKGRKHLAGVDSGSGSMNLKGCLTHITRPIKSMSSKGKAYGKFDKKKWIKRVRGYAKSKTKDIFNEE